MDTFMEAFEYAANRSKVVFGSGTIAKLPNILASRGLSRPLLLSTPQQLDQAQQVQKLLSGEAAGIFSEATMHTPVEVTDRAVEFAKSTNADSLVSVGGGSTIGLGKAIGIRTGLYHITIPTTYAGSEVTPILGETSDGLKTTRSDPSILPDAVIYDVDLTMTLPVGLSAYSGINAIAHAVEALYAQNTNPIIKMFAQEGVRSLAAALPEISKDPASQAARLSALYGAWLCGVCLGSVGMSIHHKLCHTLGGSFNLPHAETHTIVLPHALSYNASQVPHDMQRIASALGDDGGDAISGLNALLDKLPVKRGLGELGMREEDIDKAADIAMTKAYWNPRPIERDAIRELLRRAWAGEPARADL